MSNTKAASTAATKKLQQITERLRKALEVVNIAQVKAELKKSKSIKLNEVSEPVRNEFIRLRDIAKDIFL